MKKQLKTLTFLIALVLMAVPLFIVPAIADSATISAPSSVIMGEEFTVTVNFSSNAGIGALNDAYMTYNADIIQCVSYPNGTYIEFPGQCNIEFHDTNGPKNVSFTFKFKGIKNATAGITVEAGIYKNDDSGEEKESQSTRVKVVDKSTLSGNANLKSLILSAGSLSPSFNPNVTTYNVTVDYSITEVLVSATSEESAAQISVEGSKKMKVGDNQRTVVVTAPNGTKKSYVLNIKRLASSENVSTPTDDPQVPDNTNSNPYEITVNGQKKYLANDYSLVQIPEGFTNSTAFINGTDMPALTNTVGDRVLVYGTDETGANGRFYLFNAEEITFTLYMNYVSQGANFVFLDYVADANVPAGYYYCPVQIGEYSFNGFKYVDEAYSDFSIIYAETVGGTKAFYRYDKSDGSFQKAIEFSREMEDIKNNPLPTNVNIYERFMAMNTKGKLVIISLLLILILVIVLIVITVVKKARGNNFADGINDLTGMNEESNELFYTGGYEDFNDDNTVNPITIDSAYHLNSDDEDKE